MQAMIRQDVPSHHRSHFKSYWRYCSQPTTIFEADDKGMAVFINEGDVCLDALQAKFPAPSGFTFFFSENNSSVIIESHYPIALAETPWTEICKLAEDYPFIFVATHYGPVELRKQLPHDCYQTYYTNKEDADYDNLVGFDSNTIAKVGQGSYNSHAGSISFLRVIHDPKTAKRLQGYKRRAENNRKKPRKPIEIKVSEISIGDLRNTLDGFVREFVGPFDGATLSTKLHFHQNSVPRASRAARHKNVRKRLISSINQMRKNCIRLKRDWRNAVCSNANCHYNSSGGYGFEEGMAFYEIYLARFEKYIPLLRKSEDAEFQTFGRWLKLEQLRYTKAFKDANKQLEKLR